MSGGVNVLPDKLLLLEALEVFVNRGIDSEFRRGLDVPFEERVDVVIGVKEAVVFGHVAVSAVAEAGCHVSPDGVACPDIVDCESHG